MTTVEAIFNKQVDKRALLVGLSGAGAVALGGALYESPEKIRDGEALQALHTVQAAAAEIAKRGVDGRTTSEETIAAILRRESSSIAEMRVALSEPLEHYTTGEGRYVRGGMRQLERIWWMDYWARLDKIYLLIPTNR